MKEEGNTETFGKSICSGMGLSVIPCSSSNDLGILMMMGEGDVWAFLCTPTFSRAAGRSTHACV